VPQVSRLAGIAKNLTASFSSHLVATLQQVLLTPLLLKTYGAAGFGEWLTLSACVSYLGTLDFGIQTFVNQDLTVRYHGGDMKEFHVLQSTALRMLLGIVFTAGTLALVILVLPLEHWLKMDGSGSGPPLTAQVVRGAVFALALQVLASIIFGFLSGQFMVLGRAHIGGYWNNAKNVCLILFALPCIVVHTSFRILAFSQLAAVLICTLGALITLYRIGRDIFPTLRYWDGGSVGKILKPSGYFAMLFSCQFLVYQAPILILQRGIGPVAVAVFSVSRTVFSMTRNVINGISQAIGPEITKLYGQRDWPRIGRLYDYSERVIFAMIPLANVGTLLLCPLLLTLWLRKPQMFVPNVYVLFAAVSVIISAKEHKLSFQYYTNMHREMARFMFGTYLALVAAWLLLVPRFGVSGLLWAWLVAESVQAIYTMRLNVKLFSSHERLAALYPIRMIVLSTALLASMVTILPRVASQSLPLQGALALCAGLSIAVIDVPLFGLIPVWASLRDRFLNRSL